MKRSVFVDAIGTVAPIRGDSHLKTKGGGRGAASADRRPTRCALTIATPLCLLLIFSQQFFSGPLQVGGLYSRVIGPLQLAHVLMLGLAALSIADLLWTGRRLEVPRQLRGPMLLGLIALLSAFVIGTLRGGHNLFFEWRDILLGVIAFFAVGRAAAIYNRRRAVVVGYLLLGGVYAVVLLGNFLSGSGITTAATGRTPISDGPTISALGFVVCLAAAVHKPERLLERTMIRGGGVACAVVVAISLRRTYWAELLIALSLLLLSSQMRRRRAGILVAAFVSIGIWLQTSGATLILERLRSFDVFSATGQTAGTNQGHIDDIALGWQQIKHSPLTGLGVGVSYDTRQLGWKVDSFGVHNGPLTVWLVFGLFGLVAYLWWAFAAVNALSIAAANAEAHQDTDRAALARAGLAWLVAAFVVSLFFSPWPFGGAQLAVHAGVILGATVTQERYAVKCPEVRRQSRSRPGCKDPRPGSAPGRTGSPLKKVRPSMRRPRPSNSPALD